jgi:hypothetical protein
MPTGKGSIDEYCCKCKVLASKVYWVGDKEDPHRSVGPCHPFFWLLVPEVCD